MVHVNQLLQIYLQQLPLWLLRLALGLHHFSQFPRHLLRLQGNSKAENTAFHQDL
jgi:hypothetical protein